MVNWSQHLMKPSLVRHIEPGLLEMSVDHSSSALTLPWHIVIFWKEIYLWSQSFNCDCWEALSLFLVWHLRRWRNHFQSTESAQTSPRRELESLCWCFSGGWPSLLVSTFWYSSVATLSEVVLEHSLLWSWIREAWTSSCHPNSSWSVGEGQLSC